MFIRIINTILVILMFGSMVTKAESQSEKQIELKYGLFSPPRYTYSQQEPRKIYSNPLNYSEGLQGLVESDPAALQEANVALEYNRLALIGSAGMVLGLTLQLLTAGSFSLTPPLIVVGSATFNMINMSIAKKHLSRAVALFNENQ